MQTYGSKINEKTSNTYHIGSNDNGRRTICICTSRAASTVHNTDVFDSASTLLIAESVTLPENGTDVECTISTDALTRQVCVDTTPTGGDNFFEFVDVSVGGTSIYVDGNPTESIGSASQPNAIRDLFSLLGSKGIGEEFGPIIAPAGDDVVITFQDNTGNGSAEDVIIDVIVGVDGSTDAALSCSEVVF